ncbi:MAG: hypothetical protein BWY78_01418 [Alphaproteobacteria bacterium ADurb.Bin438]|nr:MAG: hypothetical protein BWY78_01418 [Alphaproteobacteria bacterium ADurb.Bin438]
MRFFVIFCLILSLSSCGNDTKRALGLTKQVPDEFSIITNAPLVVPPEFDLVNPVDENVDIVKSENKEEAKGALLSTAKEEKVSSEPIFTGFGGLGIEDMSSESKKEEVKETPYDLIRSLNSKPDEKTSDVAEDALISKMKVDSEIRSKINNEYQKSLDKNIIEEIMFWQKDKDSTEVLVNPEVEKKRLNKEQIEDKKEVQIYK